MNLIWAPISGFSSGNCSAVLTSTTKQLKLFFSRKLNNYLYSSLTCNNSKISKSIHQKNLGVVLDSKLEFSIHIKQNIKKSNEIIKLMRRSSIYLKKKALLTIYKSFFRPHFDYSDIVYDKLNNKSFINNVEKSNAKSVLQ